jgi:hypothetical protein
MTSANYETMGLDELRQYVLTHRENIQAFHVYIDRSKASGRMIAVDPSDPQWEQNLDRKIRAATSGETGLEGV